MMTTNDKLSFFQSLVVLSHQLYLYCVLLYLQYFTFILSSVCLYTVYIVSYRPGKTGGAGGAMAPPLLCQAKLYVELDFKVSTEVLNFEMIHSIYQIMVVLAVVRSIPKPKNTFEYPFIQNYYLEDILKMTSKHF